MEPRKVPEKLGRATPSGFRGPVNFGSRGLTDHTADYDFRMKSGVLRKPTSISDQKAVWRNANPPLHNSLPHEFKFLR